MSHSRHVESSCLLLISSFGGYHISERFRGLIDNDSRAAVQVVGRV